MRQRMYPCCDTPKTVYRRFLRIASDKLPDWLVLQTYRTDRGYNEMWAKIRSNGTTSMPLIWKKYSIHLGIGIDIFPVFGLYKSSYLVRLQEKAYAFCRTLLAKEYLEAIDSEELKSGNWKLHLLYSVPWRVRTCLCDILSAFIFKRVTDSCNVAIGGTAVRGSIPASAYGGNNTALFEGYYFSIPLDYDAILRQMYGDYMVLPPVSERGRGHEVVFGDIIYDCEKDYREYL